MFSKSFGAQLIISVQLVAANGIVICLSVPTEYQLKMKKAVETLWCHKWCTSSFIFPNITTSPKVSQ